MVHVDEFTSVSELIESAQRKDVERHQNEGKNDVPRKQIIPSGVKISKGGELGKSDFTKTMVDPDLVKGG